jgi:hypothetical protein
VGTDRCERHAAALLRERLMAAQDLKEAVEDLYYWQFGTAMGTADNFSSLLFTMMQKADAGNIVRLAIAFPHEFRAFREWQRAEDPAVFFDSFGVRHDHRKGP